MKQTMKKIVWLVTFLAVGSIQVFGKPFIKGPYMGQTPPGSTPQIFAPGFISDTRPHQLELWGSFSADGNTFCFDRRGYVHITENTDQGWTRPKRIMSIPFRASYCCLYPDANSIYVMYSYDRSKHYNPCRSQRTSDGWSTPQELGPPLSSPAKELGISFAANNSIYIGSTRKLKHGEDGIIWAIPFEGNTWARDEHVALNFPGGEPGIAPDESFMVFTAMNQPGGYGMRDLYLTLHLPDGTWSKPRNLGPRINSAYFEYSPRISPDKKYLFFTRANGWDYNSNDDTGDIYWVELKEYLPESYR
ncbi:MAG: hypothetical protein GY774_06160 [Planctomycetes bacterium]|nr:hypothetical protein [Planctomycetota bacterium]